VRWRPARSPAIRLWPWRGARARAGACCAVTPARSGPDRPRGAAGRRAAGRIELRVGPGPETLRSPPPGGQPGLALTDAGKTGYARYHEEVPARPRPGGPILLDTTLHGGHVAGDLPGDEDVAAIRSVHDTIAADPRVQAVPIPTGDGASFARKPGERQ
jgi:predicted O-methyltransferase YrrM